MNLLLPKDATSLAPLTAALDAASPEDRKAWVRSLDGAQQKHLYALAKGSPLTVADLVGEDGQMRISDGRNGLAMFNKFQKRFSRLGSQVVGYNDNTEIDQERMTVVMIATQCPEDVSRTNTP